jgi:hypothetical protein
VIKHNVVKDIADPAADASMLRSSLITRPGASGLLMG